MLGRRTPRTVVRPVAVAVLSVAVALLMLGLPSIGFPQATTPTASAAILPLQSGPPGLKLEFVAQGCPLKELWNVTLFTATFVNLGTKSASGGGAVPAHVVFTVAVGNYTFSPSGPPNFGLTPLPPYVTSKVDVTGKLTVVDLICEPITESFGLNGTPTLPVPAGGPPLNNTTAHPWGEAYDPSNSCLYLTEDPSTPATTGYVTAIGPTPVPGLIMSFPTGVVGTDGFNPLGIAWALSYAGAPTGYPGGFLLVADSQSNELSLFGLPDPNGSTFCWPVLLGAADAYAYAPSAVARVPLSSPYNVVFGHQAGPSAAKLGAAPGLFYVSWQNGYVAAFAGLAEGRVLANLTDPLGLSYAGPNGYAFSPNGYLEIPNFAPNGWVTSYKVAPTDIGPAGAPALGAVTNSAKSLDQVVWTVTAPFLQTQPNATHATRAVVATSDSNFGINGNIQGGGGTSFGDVPGCTPGTPLGGVMGELAFPTALGCLNAVGTTLQPVPANAPLTFGSTWARSTQDVYQVVPYFATNPTPSYPEGEVESVTFTQVGCGLLCAPGTGAGPGVGLYPIEVIWTSNAIGTVPVNFFGLGSATTGTLIVTVYGSGSVAFLPAFYLA